MTGVPRRVATHARTGTTSVRNQPCQGRGCVRVQSRSSGRAPMAARHRRQTTCTSSAWRPDSGWMSAQGTCGKAGQPGPAQREPAEGLVAAAFPRVDLAGGVPDAVVGIGPLASGRLRCVAHSGPSCALTCRHRITSPSSGRRTRHPPSLHRYQDRCRRYECGPHFGLAPDLHPRRGNRPFRRARAIARLPSCGGIGWRKLSSTAACCC